MTSNFLLENAKIDSQGLLDTPCPQLSATSIPLAAGGVWMCLMERPPVLACSWASAAVLASCLQQELPPPPDAADAAGGGGSALSDVF